MTKYFIHRLPIAIRGTLIHTQIGILSGPYFDSYGSYNILEKIDGTKEQITTLLGYAKPLEEEYHAYLDRPTKEEMNILLKTGKLLQ